PASSGERSSARSGRRDDGRPRASRRRRASSSSTSWAPRSPRTSPIPRISARPSKHSTPLTHATTTSTPSPSSSAPSPTDLAPSSPSPMTRPSQPTRSKPCHHAKLVGELYDEYGPY